MTVSMSKSFSSCSMRVQILSSYIILGMPDHMNTIFSCENMLFTFDSMVATIQPECRDTFNAGEEPCLNGKETFRKCESSLKLDAPSWKREWLVVMISPDHLMLQ